MSGAEWRFPSPADNRRRVAEWRVALERWRDLLVEVHADGRISLEQFLDAARADPADLLVERTYATFNDEQLESCIALLGGECPARPWELVELRVCGLNGAGEDLAVIDCGELLRRQRAAEQLRQRGPVSAWLAGYVSLLVAESRRRRGAM